MELVKKNIHEYKTKNKATIQITLDDDFNVPDAKPDIEQIVKERGDLHIQSVRVNGDKAEISGELEFSLLYMADVPVNMRGHMDFQEKVNVENLEGDETTTCVGEIEDLTIKAINSRKVSIKAIISLNVLSERLEDEDFAVDVDTEKENNSDNLQFRKKDMEIAELLVNMKDNFRIKDSIELPAGKPNIDELLWYDVAIKSMEVKASDEGLVINGELNTFILYSAADESQSLQWYETSSVFDGTVDVSGSNADMITYVSYIIQSLDVEVKPDYDGEDRVVAVELVLELDIRGYDEKQISIIDDIYSPIKNIELDTKPAKLQKLLVRNNSKCRINQRLKVNPSNKILQICNCTGTAKVDDVTVTEEGIEVDGVVNVNIFFVTSDDHMPMGCMKGALPFNHKINVATGKDNDKMQYNINVNLEQLNAVMAGSEEIEIKASISLDTICFVMITENVIKEMKIENLEENSYSDIPSIIGYVVKDEDCLWDIAKKYHTTIDTIKTSNKLQNDYVKLGDKLILVKSERG